jgi:hypothetical protein
VLTVGLRLSNGSSLRRRFLFSDTILTVLEVISFREGVEVEKVDGRGTFKIYTRFECSF